MAEYPASHLHLAGFVLALMVGAYALLPAKDTQALAGKPPAAEAADAWLEVGPPMPPSYFVAGVFVHVQPGDNMAKIFRRHGLSEAELQRVMAAMEEEPDYLTYLRPDDLLTFDLSEKGELQSLRYRKQENFLKVLQIDRRADGFAASWETLTTVAHTAFKEGRISSDAPTLWQAAKAAGLSESLIMELAIIFQWDISFALDVRLDDSFSVVYEEAYAQGIRVGEGRILAARFNTRREGHMQSYEAVYYKDATDGAGYYTPDGRPMQKAFLRDPVSFLFVSSGFDPNRLHPIHKRRMPHNGTDYAARKNTPVRASGNGKVVRREYHAGSGNYIVLQHGKHHGKRYMTKYMHLSRFALGLKVGQTVQQGEVIGYVGDTGWATAPHLHYEFLVNGVHRNPQTYPLPDAEPIAESEMHLFRKSTLPALAQLDRGAASQMVADSQDPASPAVGTVGR